MFREVLHETMMRTEGCLGALVMGTDGIIVEQVWQNSEKKNASETVVAEFISLFKNLRHTTEELNFGKLNEITLSSDNGSFIFRFVSDDYLIIMLLSQERNFGRGRYELQRAELLLEKELVL